MLYRLLYALLYLLSLIPWSLHYLWADLVLFPLVYHVLHYRKTLVRQQLAECFPEKSDNERRKIERDFYHWFCDYIVENVKQVSMTQADIKRHMTFEGVEALCRDFKASDASLCVVYLGHYANWEWITSLNLHTDADLKLAQVYHPLENEVIDRIMTKNRCKCGSDNVPMKETLRYILQHKRDGQRVVMGFIADQSPYLYHIRHWMQWMNHESPVIIGAETIGQKVGAVYYYLDVQRTARRGYYHTIVRPLAPAEHSTPYPMTEAYMHALAQSIQRDPAPWLWTHRRWKHKRAQVEPLLKQKK